MFGGNDNAAMQPGDEPQTALTAGTGTDTSVNDATNAGTAATPTAYDAGGFAGNVTAPPADAGAHDTAAANAGNDDAAAAHDPTMTPMTVDTDDLLDLKQQALQQLTPLVGHLDQNPEEKFRTTMMMIQASDNADLLKDAYAAAQQIDDEKARAQALLDVINEINYFTQHQASQQ